MKTNEKTCLSNTEPDTAKQLANWMGEYVTWMKIIVMQNSTGMLEHGVNVYQLVSQC
jgi:hypothetical protein